MKIDLLKSLQLRLDIKSLTLFGLLSLYVVVTLFVFEQGVLPSIQQGTTSEVFADDATVYMYMADSLREGRSEPAVMIPLAKFPNTFWMPVAIWYVLNNAYLVLLFNVAVFLVSILLLSKSMRFSHAGFMLLLLLNPTTTTSLLSVNKEILDLLVLSLFLFARKNRKTGLLIFALLFALFNRFEVCVVLITLMIAGSRLNPFRRRRFVTLALLILALSIIMPLWGAQELARRFEEAQAGQTIAVLDMMQMHYLYALAVVPKIAKNLFGFLAESTVWDAGNSWGLIMFFNNLASAVVICSLLVKRSFTLRNDLVYFCALGAAVVAQALIIQPRYFYFVYVMLCLQAARRKALPGAASGVLSNGVLKVRPTSVLRPKEIAFE